MIDLNDLKSEDQASLDKKNKGGIKEKDKLYTETTTLVGFVPWEPWVPMPHPFREVLFAKEMIDRGEKLMV